MPCSEGKKHRKLVEKTIDDDILNDQLADWIIHHHTQEWKIQKFEEKKKILEKHEFQKYVQLRMPFPIKNESTQKGNLGEIILAEYLKACSGLELLIHKLRFNPNVEQSMKGDDVLLFDKSNIKSKLFLGEAKFRSSPTKDVVVEIVGSLSEDNVPISLAFVSERLLEIGEGDLADQVDDLISELHNDKIEINYIGFLMSSSTTASQVERHLESSNNRMVFISFSLRDPASLVQNSYSNAIEKIRER